MGKNASRVCVLGFTLASTAALGFPGSAAADDTLSGDCATTLHGARTQGLALDLGAPLNLPGLLTIGLDSRSGGSREEAKAPLVSLPVGDTVQALGVGDLPAVDGVCTTAQGLVNGVGDTTQNLLGGGDTTKPPGNPGTPAPPTTPPPGTPGNPVPPGSPGGTPSPNPGGSTNPVTSNPIVLDAGVSVAGVFVNGAFLPGGLGSSVIIPIAPPAEAPNIGGVGVPPVVIADRSGTAQALPATNNAPARLPLLLAVLALAVVAAALIRTWFRRTPSS
jgi:hypothetical protein